MSKMFYKIALLFKGGLTEEEANTEYAKAVEELKAYGNIPQEIKPNKISLAYPIAKSTEAYFATIKFEPTEEVVVNFKDWLKKANVLRVLITKNDSLTVEKVAGFSPLTKAIGEEIPAIITEKPIVSEPEILEVVVSTPLEVVENKDVIEVVKKSKVEEKPEVDMNALDEKLEELLK